MIEINGIKFKRLLWEKDGISVVENQGGDFGIFYNKEPRVFLSRLQLVSLGHAALSLA